MLYKVCNSMTIKDLLSICSCNKAAISRHSSSSSRERYRPTVQCTSPVPSDVHVQAPYLSPVHVANAKCHAKIAEGRYAIKQL